MLVCVKVESPEKGKTEEQEQYSQFKLKTKMIQMCQRIIYIVMRNLHPVKQNKPKDKGHGWWSHSRNQCGH